MFSIFTFSKFKPVAGYFLPYIETLTFFPVYKMILSLVYKVTCVNLVLYCQGDAFN